MRQLRLPIGLLSILTLAACGSPAPSALAPSEETAAPATAISVPSASAAQSPVPTDSPESNVPLLAFWPYQGGEVGLVNADGADLRALNVDPAASEQDLRWLPDGQHFLVTTTGDPWQVWLASLDANDNRVLDGVGSWAEMSPSGRYVTWNDDTGQVVRDLSSGTDLQQPDGWDLAFPAYWSPRSDLLAASVGDGKSRLEILDPASGKARDLTPKGTSITDLAWSPDGSRIGALAYEGDRQVLLVIDVGTGTADEISDLSGLEDPSFGWSPDGRMVAFVSGENQMTVDPLDGEPVVVDGQPALIDSSVWSPDSRSFAYARGSDIVVRDLASGTETVLDAAPAGERDRKRILLA